MTSKTFRAARRLCWLMLLMTAGVLHACANDNQGSDDSEGDRDSIAMASCDDAGIEVRTVRAALEDVCQGDPDSFTLEIDNPYFPLVVGAVRIMEGTEDGAEIRVEHHVLDETEMIDGVTTRVLEEREYEDDEVIEISRNWFAQADDGSVCYFGEEVDIYEDGEIVAHEGAWRAGENGAMAGIVMPAEPKLGMSYAQETAPDDDAWDHASHVAEGEEIEVPGGTFTDTLRTIEWTPIEPDEISPKAYAHGVGMIIDNVVELTSYEE